MKGKIYVGDKAIEEKIGRKVRWELQFSKTSAGFQSGKYDFYFRGDTLGIDSVADLVDTAESLGNWWTSSVFKENLITLLYLPYKKRKGMITMVPPNTGASVRFVQD